MEPIERAWLSLEGLSVGDAFGERFFGVDEHMATLVERRTMPGARTWRYTDDTEMAVSIVQELARAGTVDRDELASAFARRMDPSRGYGAGAYRILVHVKEGGDWRRASRENFRGNGSVGNGAAMRVAPWAPSSHTTSSGASTRRGFPPRSRTLTTRASQARSRWPPLQR